MHYRISVYLSVSAEGVVKLSVSAESQFITFGMVSVLAETKNVVSVSLYWKDQGLYLCYRGEGEITI
jgi:hypothetical protein